jgi:Domain of unknown function (DUF4249)
MKRLIGHIALIIMIMVLGTCSEPYTPEISKYENLLVVDGVITDENGLCTVKLSRSFSYNETEGTPEQQAVVLIKDDQGNAVSLAETSPGVYQTTDKDFRGIIGRKYQLYIQTSDQQIWESDNVELKKVPKIQQVYAEFEKKPGEPGNGEGMQVYVDTYDPDNQTRYYRYDYEETWEFVVPYPSYYIVVNNLLRFRPDDVGKCWKTAPSDEIIIATSENMQSDIIKRFPVHFVSTVGNRLTIRYSILVRQYSLSREAYVYWKQVRDVNQDLGTIFDKQPAQIRGNIYNVKDPELPVIGFFEATCVDTARFFITRSELPHNAVIISDFSICRYNYLVIRKNSFLAYDERGYCMVGDDFSQGPGGLGIVMPFKCCDCTMTGSNKRPSFW